MSRLTSLNNIYKDERCKRNCVKSLKRRLMFLLERSFTVLLSSVFSRTETWLNVKINFLKVGVNVNVRFLSKTSKSKERKSFFFLLGKTSPSSEVFVYIIPIFFNWFSNLSWFIYNKIKWNSNEIQMKFKLNQNKSNQNKSNQNQIKSK